MRARLAALGCTAAAALGGLGLAPAAAGAASLPKAAMSITTGAASYPYGTRVSFTVTLKARVPGATVSVYATPAGGKRILMTTSKVDSAGKLHPHYKVTRNTTFTAVFAGDAKDAANAVSRAVTVPAQVSAAITGYYTTTVIGGASYRVYHGASTLTLKATVRPAKRGECLQPETEQYDSGTGWDADSKYGCDRLDGQSHDTAPFQLRQAVGDRYRIRADYARGSDTANLSASSPWLYFEVVR